MVSDMNNEQTIQWFPGHMAKTRRQIAEVLPMVDVVAELLDARIPRASRNPELNAMIGGKPLVVILNKCDLADPAVTAQWVSFFNRSGALTVAADCKTGTGLSALIPLIQNHLRDRFQALAEKGMTGRTPRILVAGIPNVGKSSLINRLSDRARAKTEDRPGVTRKNQWYSVSDRSARTHPRQPGSKGSENKKGAELLDTPGVLWPKFEDPEAGFNLAATGAVKDTLFDGEALAMKLLERLSARYPSELGTRYKLGGFEELNGEALLKLIARKRGMLVSHGEPDLERAAAVVLDEFRAGKIGRISLEEPKFETMFQT